MIAQTLLSVSLPAFVAAAAVSWPILALVARRHPNVPARLIVGTAISVGVAAGLLALMVAVLGSTSHAQAPWGYLLIIGAITGAALRWDSEPRSLGVWGGVATGLAVGAALSVGLLATLAWAIGPLNALGPH